MTPLQGPPSLRVACPTCDAMIGQRCQVWAMGDRKRLYRLRTASKQHPARTAAARDAGYLLPPGRPARAAS